MARYALVDSNDQIKRERDESTLDPSKPVADGWRWIPIVNETIELQTPGNSDVKSSFAEYVEPTRVRRVRTIVDKTAQEIADEKDAIVSFLDTPSRDTQYASLILTRDIISVLFNAINALREADGAAPLTLVQFATFFEANKDSISNTQMKNYLKERFG